MFFLIKRYKPLYRRSNNIVENVYDGVDVEEEEKERYNQKIEKLLNVIEERRCSLQSCSALLGTNDELTKSIFSELEGLKEAYRIITAYGSNEK